MGRGRHGSTAPTGASSISSIPWAPPLGQMPFPLTKRHKLQENSAPSCMKCHAAHPVVSLGSAHGFLQRDGDRGWVPQAVKVAVGQCQCPPKVQPGSQLTHTLLAAREALGGVELHRWAGWAAGEAGEGVACSSLADRLQLSESNRTSTAAIR